MKFLVLLLNCLVLAIGLAAVLVALAFAPVVQTWIAQAWLARQSSVHGSLGSISAHFGKLEVTELQLKLDGALLTLPSLNAELPLTTALMDHRFLVRRLVAKGWTLDLRQTPVTPGAGDKPESAPKRDGSVEAITPMEAVPAQKIALLFRGILSRWALPWDVSLDGADLEGDVVLAAPVGKMPTRVHVAIKGGGMAAGREGDFAFDASSDIIDLSLAEIAVTGHGRLAVSMASPRTFGRVEAKAEVSANGGPFPNGVAFSADVSASLGTGEEIYSLDLRRGGEPVAMVVVHWPEQATQFAGTWKLDLEDSDVALFTLDRPLPHFTAEGEGRFDSDISFTRIHAMGRLKSSMSSLEVLAPWLERLGAVTVEADFDATRSGQSLRMDHLKASLAGGGPAVVVRSLQPFEIDERTGELKPLNPADDWMEASVRGFPLAWLFEPTNALALSGGDAAGEFIVRTDKGKFAVRSKAPLTAAGVSVQRGPHVFGRKLDLSVSLAADQSAEGWHFQANPLIVDCSGRRLATFDAKGSVPAAPDDPVAITGTWKADLEALASTAAAPDLGWIKGRSASGDFTTTVGSSTELNGKLTVVGQDEHHTITAGVHAELSPDGRISFLAPVKMTAGPGVSDLTTEGTWLRDQAGTRLYLKLSGKDVFAEHLRMIAASLAAAGGAPMVLSAGPDPAVNVSDRVPFWGNWAGRVTVGFGQVKAGDYVFKNVDGALLIAPGSVRLEGGQGALGEKHFTNLAGAISFDPAAEFHYSLNATASLARIDAESLFPAADYRNNPPVEGAFSIAGTLVANGNNLQDLISRAREEFEVTSTAGIVRVLKTDVDEAIPRETESVASEDLGRVGFGVGSIFGVNSIGSGKRTISPTAENVIRFINDVSEIGFDQTTVKAVREADGTIQLKEISMAAPDELIKGSGQISGDKNLTLRSRPLSFDFQLWARGTPAKRLRKAGLLSTQKDDKGYSLFIQPIHFGGTVQEIDRRQWHDLLVKAAEQNPVVPPKKTP